MVNAQRKKILLVDDNHDILDLLEIYLFRDYDISTALNGFDGLQKVKSENPDCVITDIMMPVMNGIKFFNTMRKQGDEHAVPVIGITSFVKKLTTKSLLNMGFFRVLFKPLSREDVRAAVQEALDISGGNGA
jgi:CheY-like chemotaxis protein